MSDTARSEEDFLDHELIKFEQTQEPTTLLRILYEMKERIVALEARSFPSLSDVGEHAAIPSPDISWKCQVCGEHINHSIHNVETGVVL